MTEQFIGKEIKVAVEGEVQSPVSFRLDGREYKITEIINEWSDHGFGKSVTGKRKWWQRHHRNYYRVKTDSVDIFEIYFDRGVNNRYPERRKWFASRKT